MHSHCFSRRIAHASPRMNVSSDSLALNPNSFNRPGPAFSPRQSHLHSVLTCLFIHKGIFLKRIVQCSNLYSTIWAYRARLALSPCCHIDYLLFIIISIIIIFTNFTYTTPRLSARTLLTTAEHYVSISCKTACGSIRRSIRGNVCVRICCCSFLFFFFSPPTIYTTLVDDHWSRFLSCFSCLISRRSRKASLHSFGLSLFFSHLPVLLFFLISSLP